MDEDQTPIVDIRVVNQLQRTMKRDENGKILLVEEVVGYKIEFRRMNCDNWEPLTVINEMLGGIMPLLEDKGIASGNLQKIYGGIK